MSVTYVLSCLVSSLLIVTCRGQWKWDDIGDPVHPVCSSIATVRTDSSYRSYGICDGRLQERYWSGSSWEWRTHGTPWGLQTGEKLASAPCIVYDGKIFVVTNFGRLYERYWMDTFWVWVPHGKAMDSEDIQADIGCTVVHNEYTDRVFVVGTDSQLYERYWNWEAEDWVWRAHGSPPGTAVGSSIDSCDLNECRSQVYVVAADGNLHLLDIGIGNVGTPTWIPIGSPDLENVQTVSFSPDGLFITTYENNICEFIFDSASWLCYSKPEGTIIQLASISKAIKVSGCSGLRGSRYVFMYSRDPATDQIANMFSVRIKKRYSPRWKYHGNIGDLQYVGSPEIFVPENCPEVYAVRSDGSVFKRYHPL